MAGATPMTYDFWYWNGIPGRGEFVRLALEAGQIPYRERAREGGGEERRLLDDLNRHRMDPPFAPPYLVTNEATIAQTANILHFLGEKHGLAPADAAGRFWVAQLQLTIADMVSEAHDVHHPVDINAYYEDQKEEAARRSQSFRSARIPKYLGYFERVLEARGNWVTGGARWSYADLSLFQLIEGLRFAFPRRMAVVETNIPKLIDLRDRVAGMAELQEYLASDRRLKFGDGIFRHYPELDGDA
jgi:glutathione S-transferase